MAGGGGVDLSHPGWWALGWAVLSNILAAAVAIYVWITTRTAASAARVEQAEEALSRRIAQAAAEHDPLRVSIARLDEAVKHAPNDSDIVRVHERIDRLSEGVSEIRGGIKRIEHAVDLMHSYLLESKGGA